MLERNCLCLPIQSIYAIVLTRPPFTLSEKGVKRLKPRPKIKMYHDTQSFKEEFVFPVSLLILRFYFHRQTEEFLNSG